MRRMDKPFRVFIGLVPTGYLDTTHIAQMIRDGMVFCGAKSRLEHGIAVRRVLVRPMIPAAGKSIPACLYTHPEFVRFTVQELLGSVPRAEITVAETSMPPFSTTRALKLAHGNSDVFRAHGYFELNHLFPGRVTVTPLEDTTQLRYRLSKGAVLTRSDREEVMAFDPYLPLSQEDASPSASREVWRRRLANEIRASRHFRDSRFVVYCPKVRIDVASDGFFGAVRMGAPHANWSELADHRICDALEVCTPDLVVGDAIVIPVGGHALCQKGVELGAVLVSNNALAHDWIATKILNMDFARIRHLKMAVERGWGPASFAQIELGGAGSEGLHQLSQKTRMWEISFPRLEEFAKRFETENPGTSFPLEVLSGRPYEHSGSHGLFLDWLFENYEIPARRVEMLNWPRASVCVGPVHALPSHYLVYAIGDRAIRSLGPMISSRRRILAVGNVELSAIQLKNERNHLLVEVSGAPPVPSEVRRAFMLASLGRMGRGLYGLSRIPAFWSKLRTRWRAAKPAPHAEPAVTITSRMRHNRWWALPEPPELMTEEAKAACVCPPGPLAR